MVKICEELNYVHNQNIRTLNQIFNDAKNIKNMTELEMVRKNIGLFCLENLFKHENLRLCNAKLGIPLYQSLYQKPFYSKEFLPIFLRSKINENITRDIICSFLLETPLSKNVNYFNIKLNIILGKINKDSLIILKQNTTISATSLDGKVVGDIPFLNQKIIDKKVFSEILTEQNEKLTVIDQNVVGDNLNEQVAPNLLVGGQGIVEQYIYFTECMFKTKNQINYSNQKLGNLFSILSKKNFQKNLIIQLYNENPSIELNFIEKFYKSRIIEKTIVPDSKNLFKNKGVVLDEKTNLRFKEINIVFLKQLKKDPLIFKDIYYQKNNMHVNFTKLKNIMSSEDPEIQKFFDNNIKTRIINASNGVFTLKRPRT